MEQPLPSGLTGPNFLDLFACDNVKLRQVTAGLAYVMRVGTPLENWRVAQKSLSAIDQRIAELLRRSDLPPVETKALPALVRARETAKRLADKCWARYRRNFERENSGGAQG
jgi:hypothetical protein